MDVMRGQHRITKRDVQCAHLSGRKLITSLDRRLARDRRRKTLVPCVRPRIAVAGERRERITQAALGIEPRMRHRHRTDDERVPAEPLDLEPELLEQLAILLERLALRGAEMQ